LRQARLEAEKDHIEDFAPEVAWVTRSGDTNLAGCALSTRGALRTTTRPNVESRKKPKSGGLRGRW